VGDKLFECIFADFAFQHFNERVIELEISRREFREGRVSIGVAFEIIQRYLKSRFCAKTRIMLDVVLVVAGSIGRDLNNKLGTIYIVFGRDGQKLVEEILVGYSGTVEVAGDVEAIVVSAAPFLQLNAGLLKHIVVEKVNCMGLLHKLYILAGHKKTIAGVLPTGHSLGTPDVACVGINDKLEIIKYLSVCKDSFHIFLLEAFLLRRCNDKTFRGEEIEFIRFFS
jgi:hypothetical protein